MNYSPIVIGAQVVVSILIVLFILIQERSSGAGGIFGGAGSEFYQRRRGLERLVFFATIFLVALFGGLSILSLIVK